MAEKVKVSREVAEFIKSYEEHNGGIPGWEDYLIRDHTGSFVKNFEDVNEEAMCMKDITPMQLAKMLINGYEIEETPEEILLLQYKNKRYLTEASNTDVKWEHDAFANGITFTLETLNIKIKGINT